jgi:hypothetical protein
MESQPKERAETRCLSCNRRSPHPAPYAPQLVPIQCLLVHLEYGGCLHDSLRATPDEAAMWGVFVAGSPSHSLTANRNESACVGSDRADLPDYKGPPGGRIQAAHQEGSWATSTGTSGGTLLRRLSAGKPINRCDTFADPAQHRHRDEVTERRRRAPTIRTAQKPLANKSCKLLIPGRLKPDLFQTSTVYYGCSEQPSSQTFGIRGCDTWSLNQDE